jgi:PhoPQ-activated pathogenicity-related protein
LRLETSDSRLTSHVSYHSLLVTRYYLASWLLCLENSDYSYYLVCMAEPFNNDVLQHFHQKIMITSITYSIANHYYIHYLRGNRKTRKPRTEAENWDPMITSTSQFHQVTPFSPSHCASTAPQTRRRQALSVTLTHRNKIEMAYQVMNIDPYPDRREFLSRL